MQSNQPEDVHQLLKPLLELLELRGRAHHEQVAAMKETVDKAVAMTEAAVQLSAHAELKTSGVAEEIGKLREGIDALASVAAGPSAAIRPLMGMLTVTVGVLRIGLDLPEQGRNALVVRCADAMQEFIEKFDQMATKPLGPEWVELVNQLTAIPVRVMTGIQDDLMKAAATGTQPSESC